MFSDKMSLKVHQSIKNDRNEDDGARKSSDSTLATLSRRKTNRTTKRLSSLLLFHLYVFNSDVYEPTVVDGTRSSARRAQRHPIIRRTTASGERILP